MDLKRLEFIERLKAVSSFIIIVFAFAGLVLLWTSVDEEETDFTVTFEFDCEEVIATPKRYDLEIVDECNKKLLERTGKSRQNSTII